MTQNYHQSAYSTSHPWPLLVYTPTGAAKRLLGLYCFQHVFDRSGWNLTQCRKGFMIEHRQWVCAVEKLACFESALFGIAFEAMAVAFWWFSVHVNVQNISLYTCLRQHLRTCTSKTAKITKAAHSHSQCDAGNKPVSYYSFRIPRRVGGWVGLST